MSKPMLETTKGIKISLYGTKKKEYSKQSMKKTYLEMDIKDEVISGKVKRNTKQH